MFKYKTTYFFEMPVLFSEFRLAKENVKENIIS